MIAGAKPCEGKTLPTYKYPNYYEKLSPASRITLKHQGGTMSDDEATAFESDQFHSLYSKLREWDDKAKEEHQVLPSLNKYKRMAVGQLMDQ